VSQPTIKHVTAYANGESIDGVHFNLSTEQVSSGAALAQFLSKEVIVTKANNDPTNPTESSRVVGDRVFTGKGKQVESFADISDGDRLYVVAPGLFFVWPFIELGHKVFVDSATSPTGKPMILESMSDSPRVFHVKNFFSDEEADQLIENALSISDEATKLKKSKVGTNDQSSLSSVRTSENAFDTESETATALNRRAFHLLGMPNEYSRERCDGLQLLRYQQRQAYIPHEDWFEVHEGGDFNLDPTTDGGSNRFATVFCTSATLPTGAKLCFQWLKCLKAMIRSTSTQ